MSRYGFVVDDEYPRAIGTIFLPIMVERSRLCFVVDDEYPQAPGTIFLPMGSGMTSHMLLVRRISVLLRGMRPRGGPLLAAREADLSREIRRLAKRSR